MINPTISTLFVGGKKRTFIAPFHISPSHHIIGHGNRNQNSSPVENLDDHRANIMYLNKIKEAAAVNRACDDKTGHSRGVVKSLYEQGYEFVRWNPDLKKPYVHPESGQVLLAWLVYEPEEARIKAQQALKCQANQLATASENEAQACLSERYEIFLKVRREFQRRLEHGIDLKEPLLFDTTLPPEATPQAMSKNYNVVCGRGVNPEEHPGNSALRALVEDSAPVYEQARSNKHKEHVVVSSWRTIQFFGGQFVDRDGNLMPDKKIKRDMIGQRLRDCLRNSRANNMNNRTGWNTPISISTKDKTLTLQQEDTRSMVCISDASHENDQTIEFKPEMSISGPMGTVMSAWADTCEITMFGGDDESMIPDLAPLEYMGPMDSFDSDIDDDNDAAFREEDSDTVKYPHKEYDLDRDFMMVDADIVECFFGDDNLMSACI